MTGPLDLSRVAEELRKRGIDAVHDFLYSPHGCVEGLDVGDDFFPLWELTLEENYIALEQGNFAAILSRRTSEWVLHAPSRPRVMTG